MLHIINHETSSLLTHKRKDIFKQIRWIANNVGYISHVYFLFQRANPFLVTKKKVVKK